MLINDIQIDDTFAEAFNMRGTRVIITAQNHKWAYHAANAMTGFATSVIGCGVEAGIEREMTAVETPDGRPGVAVLMFAMGSKVLMQQLETRIGQCILTCPTAAAFAGIESEDMISLGKHLRYFGDGFQTSKLIGGKRYWRIPVMDGEFLVADVVGVSKGVGGGNLILQGVNSQLTLDAARKAVAEVQKVAGVITPFPGGVVRSGSKVGSVYKKLPASTADAYCPTLRGVTETKLHPEAHCVYEIVIDGIDEAAVRAAMKVGLYAAAGPGILHIGAGNYGGKLGKFHFHLKELV